jgi:hypothetical protein
VFCLLSNIVLAFQVKQIQLYLLDLHSVDFVEKKNNVYALQAGENKL